VARTEMGRFKNRWVCCVPANIHLGQEDCTSAVCG